RFWPHAACVGCPGRQDERPAPDPASICRMRELLRALPTVLYHPSDRASCTLADTRPSTPRRPRAGTPGFPPGRQRCNLGDCCVGAEVKQRALRVLRGGEGRPQVLTFNLDSDCGWDDGLICGGRMSILADPVSSAPAAAPRLERLRAYYGTYRELVESGHG